VKTIDVYLDQIAKVQIRFNLIQKLNIG